MAKTPVEFLQAYRRDQILSAAREVIGESGYDQSSVDQIAKRAGLSRSTVYEYFSSKEEILKGSFAAHREPLAEALARCIHRAVGLEAQLTAFFEICLSRVDENREFFLAIAFPLPLDEASAAEGPGGTEFAMVIKNFNDTVDRILADGFERGELQRPISSTDRYCLGTLIVGAMSARCRLDAPPAVEESAASFASFALRGLVPTSEQGSKEGR
ncbi:MAG: TetR/AcrR family transcriptional regulator [Deltaproteobacteria bacterium]|nr:TetR/AcrR family transcriptional regulator [Deltaproteobacteria bacterium]